MTQRKPTFRDHVAMGLFMLGSMFIVAASAMAALGIASLGVFIMGVVCQFRDVEKFGYLAMGSSVASFVMLAIGVAMLRVQDRSPKGQEDADAT